MMPMDTYPMAGMILKNGDFGSFMVRNIAELEGKSGVRLEMVQKIFLAETGTVEQLMSILTGSNVRVRVVKQKENATTITRQSIIVNDSGKVLIRAYSKVCKRNLPSKIVNQIKQQQWGIGTIISSSHLETFRKIIEVGYDPASRSVFRKYHIFYRKKIAFEIREELVGIESGPSEI